MAITLSFFNVGKCDARDAFHGFENLEVFMAMKLDELVRMKYRYQMHSTRKQSVQNSHQAFTLIADVRLYAVNLTSSIDLLG